MRNLKRALSLALASVMLLGMMVVGTGASYADVTSEDNVEAIEVIQAVGVMTGDDKGNFNPDQKVTRGEMAVVISNLLGYKATDFTSISMPFTDVPDWAKGYVAACYSNGITAGISATEYGFNYEVTTAQAALMMMKALGYFQYASDFGSDWQVATVKQGTKIDLFDGIEAGATTAMTRNEVAQIALNTLEATMVEPDDDTVNVTTPDGTTVVAGSVDYLPQTSAGTWAGTFYGADAGVIQLGEYLYKGELIVSTDSDVYGRPANKWSYGTWTEKYVNDDAIKTYTANMDTTAGKKTVAADLKGYSIDASLSSYITSGSLDTDKVAAVTGNGTIVEIFAKNGEIYNITVIQPELAQVTVKNVDDKEVTIQYNTSYTTTLDEDDDCFDAIYALSEDDYVIVTLDNNGADDATVYSAYAPTTVSGTYTKKADTKYTVGGTAYEVAENLSLIHIRCV